jgi:hypothetical protein
LDILLSNIFKDIEPVSGYHVRNHPAHAKIYPAVSWRTVSHNLTNLGDASPSHLQYPDATYLDFAMEEMRDEGCGHI